MASRDQSNVNMEGEGRSVCIATLVAVLLKALQNYLHFRQGNFQSPVFPALERSGSALPARGVGGARGVDLQCNGKG